MNNNSSLEPHLPAILDVYGIPYTGGDFLSIALTADKSRTKEILTYHRIPTPAFQLFENYKEDIRPDLPMVETGSQEAVAAAVLNGAHIVRVHDVANTVATVKIIDALVAAEE